MKTKEITITLGSSAHFLKSAVSLTYTGTDKDLKKAKKKILSLYYEVLGMELGLTKTFNKMEIKELKQFVQAKIDKT